MNASSPALLVLALFCVPSIVCAQTDGERIPDAVRVGLTVSIVDDQGRKLEGRVLSVSDDEIRLSGRPAGDIIPIGRIVRIDQPDSVKNGAAVGLCLGISFGLLGGIVDAQGGSRRGAFVAVSTVGNAIVWTALGTAVDALVDNRRTLYQRGGRRQVRIAPMAGGGVRGAAVSLAW